MMKTLSLEHIRHDWESLAERDALWAILSHDDKRGRAWNEVEFYATGERSVATLFERFAALDLPTRFEAALDFGCGAGRLTQALARRCESVTGVDVAAPMIDLARRANVHGNRVIYEVNPRPDLSVFADSTFDLVLSLITLQHLPQELTLAYLREMVRVLRPNGLMCVQLPTGRTGFHLGEVVRRLPFGERLLHGAVRALGRPVMMYAIPVDRVIATLEKAGAELVQRDPDDEGRGWRGFVYYARR